MAAAAPLAFDPIVAAINRAPVVDFLTPEERADLDQLTVDISTGRVQVIAHEDVPATFEALRHASGA